MAVGVSTVLIALTPLTLLGLGWAGVKEGYS